MRTVETALCSSLSRLSLLTLVGGVLAAQNWTQPVTLTSPAGATLPRMAYDVVRGRAVLFGGWNAPSGTIVFDQTWEYDGVGWSLRAPATVPDERDSHVMAYDLARGRTVMFGGWDLNFAMLGQTWEWDGTDWSNRMPANAPAARLLAGMVYDTTRSVTVLFGGESQVGALFGDTWEWDGTNWTQRTLPFAPSARSSHMMAYDITRGRVVLFGGIDATGLRGDTWEFDGTNWFQIVTDRAPSARSDGQMVFDLQRSRCVLFGGADATVDRNDTWEWDGTRWRELFTAARPQGNAAMAMAFDSTRNTTVVFGGFDGAGAIDDTWELGGSGGTWRTFGFGCAGGGGLVPRLVPQSMPTLGATATLDVTGLPPAGGVALLAIGLGDQTWLGLPLPVDLTPIGLTGCVGYTSFDVGATLTHTNGTASFSLPVPNNPALAGFSLFFQALSLDAAAPRPFTAALSDAAELRVN